MKYLILLLAMIANAASGEECIDTDGDGWGWTGSASCRIEQHVVEEVKPELKQCVDTDGDGWGWNGTESCIVQSKPQPTIPIKTTGLCVDTDNDGWGWNGISSCTIKREIEAETTAHIDGITDVVVMMGQSNALGNQTLVNLEHDYADERILAWTKNDGWQIANLCTQVWRGTWHPWQGGSCGNHPAFQIAKGILAKDDSRKVAIIPAGDAGQPISSWNENGSSLILARQRIESALDKLPQINHVNLIAWSQGESDHGNEHNWYNSLTDLIYRLRQENWVDAASTKFVAQETAWSSVNDVVHWLDSDNDPLTGAITASDQPLKDVAHFTGDALRVIGRRYADKYIKMGG